MTGLELLQRQLVAAVGAARPRVPEAGRLLWTIFVRLSRRRGYEAGGPSPISLTDIDAYCRLMRMPLQPHHVAILAAMDDAWLARSVETSAGQPEAALRGVPHAINAEIFDAVFG